MAFDKTIDQIQLDPIQSAPVTALDNALVFGTFRKNAIIFQVDATAISATFVVEGTLDGVRWVGVAFHSMNGTDRNVQVANVALTAASTTALLARVSGFQSVRVRCSAFTSATAASIKGRTLLGDVN